MAPMAGGSIRTAAVSFVLLALLGCSNDEEPEGVTTEATATAPAAPPETDASSPSPAPTPEATATATTAPAEPAQESYTVQPGDTLTDIARRFGTTVDALVEANGIDDPDVINVGQELVVPAEGG